MRQPTGVRQGDVLLVPRTLQAKAAKPLTSPQFQRVVPVKGRYILAEGEETGHHHSVPATANVSLVSDGTHTILAVHKRAVKLTHQEHDALPVGVDEYDVILQRHTSPDAEHKVIRMLD